MSKLPEFSASQPVIYQTALSNFVTGDTMAFHLLNDIQSLKQYLSFHPGEFKLYKDWRIHIYGYFVIPTVEYVPFPQRLLLCSFSTLFQSDETLQLILSQRGIAPCRNSFTPTRIQTL